MPMIDTVRLVRLTSWLSPAFPIGGFAYSQGLETAISRGAVHSMAEVAQWIDGLIHAGSIRNDAIALVLAVQAVRDNNPNGFAAIAELALALQISNERHTETCEQARSFIDSALAWPVEVPGWLNQALERPAALPVAFGALAGLHGIAARNACAGFINAFVSQQISVAIRLVPLGQSEGLALLAQCERNIAALAEEADSAVLEDIGSISYGADIASLAHEDLQVRIFRS